MPGNGDGFELKVALCHIFILVLAVTYIFVVYPRLAAGVRLDQGVLWVGGGFVASVIITGLFALNIAFFSSIIPRLWHGASQQS